MFVRVYCYVDVVRGEAVIAYIEDVRLGRLCEGVDGHLKGVRGCGNGSGKAHSGIEDGAS